MNFDTLDVGCGYDYRGQVNCDLYTEPTIHRDKYIPLNPRAIPNFVKADAHHLPFRINCFALVHCHAVLEHLHNPALALTELVRVSNGEIRVSCPHRFNAIPNLRFRRWKAHKWGMTRTWFIKSLKALGIKGYDIKVKEHPLSLFFMKMFYFPTAIMVRIKV